MIKVINNFLDKEMNENINSILKEDENFPWFYVRGVADKTDNDFMFIHLLYNKVINSAYFEKIALPFISKLNMNKLIRMKINCYTNQGNKIKHNFHVDYNTKHMVALYSINSNNGYTEFENGEKFVSKRNQLIIFDGKLKHRSVTQDDTHLRLNMNINYEL